jgi:hypothetical protein
LLFFLFDFADLLLTSLPPPDTITTMLTDTTTISTSPPFRCLQLHSITTAPFQIQTTCFPLPAATLHCLLKSNSNSNSKPTANHRTTTTKSPSSISPQARALTMADLAVILYWHPKHHHHISIRAIPQFSYVSVMNLIINNYQIHHPNPCLCCIQLPNLQFQTSPSIPLPKP